VRHGKKPQKSTSKMGQPFIGGKYSIGILACQRDKKNKENKFLVLTRANHMLP
jgi:hypothetical protein